MYEFKSTIKKLKEKIDIHLIKTIDKNIKASKLKDTMEYSIKAGGKRLRPILCIMASKLFGEKIDKCIGSACAIEMIHTYSLIHDDLPSMDNDDLRRGVPTLHIKFDEASAILAGDALLTFAFFILSKEAIKDEIKIKIINLISAASGAQGMVEGQIQDMEAERKKISLSNLKKLHLLKTGKMIEASILTGAMIADAKEAEIKILKKYAKNIGLAYQISDDVLDIEGNTKTLGKLVGSDEKKNKTTYPSLIGLEESKKMAKDLIDEAICQISYFKDKGLFFKQMAEYIILRKN